MSAIGLDVTAVNTHRPLDWKQFEQRFSSWFAAQSSNLPVFAAACLTIVLFALTPATTRLAAAQIDGLSVGIIRTVGAGLIALPLLVLLRLAPPKKIADWSLLLLSAFGSFAAFPILFSIGTQRTSGCHAALIMAVMPLLVGCTGMVLDRRLPRPTWFFGAAIAVAGEIALVCVRSGGASATATLTGDAIVLAGCVLFALGVVAGAQLSLRINPLSATFWAITVASIGLLPLAVMHWWTMPLSYHAFTSTTWAAVVHITIGATIIANVSWLWALSRGGLVRVAPIQFAQPVCALVFASALLDERLNGALVLVAAVIIFGTITACRGAKGTAQRENTETNLLSKLASVSDFTLRNSLYRNRR